jgi:membrane-associated phospholipid phosphatase
MVNERRGLPAARALSIVFSPPLAAIACYVLVSYFTPPSFGQGLVWSLLALTVQLLPCTLLYSWRLRNGDYSDADVSNRHDRNELDLLGSISVLGSVALLVVLGAPPAFVALALGTLGIGVCFGVINLFWKISMHAATMASLATIATFFSPRLGGLLWVCTLAVGWARVRTHNHTVAQVLAGAALAVVLVAGTFTWLVA